MLINGRYETAELLGDGLLAQTYAARDCQTGADVVVKQITLKGMPGWKPLELFEREVAVLQAVKHPGVPRFVDAFQTKGDGASLAMVLVVERVPGESLLALIQRQHRWQEAEARRVLASLLAILDHLHALSPPVIHRDIKPSNVILRPDGNPVLIDFGAVNDLARTGHHSLTVVGTVGYLPPEQAMGAAVPASDLYALGATMVHALTHCHPSDLQRHGLRLVFGDRLGCSRQLVEILERMVEPDLDRRYPRAAEVLADLRRPPDELVPARERHHLTVRRPVTLELPASPREVTQGAEKKISQLAFFKAVNVSLGVIIASLPAVFALSFGEFGRSIGLGGLAAILAGTVAAGRATRNSTRRQYREIYRDGVAVPGFVVSVNTTTETGTLYADVRYTYEVNGKHLPGEIYYSDRAASQLTDKPAVLVVYDPRDPRRHVAQVVAP